jgi:hypothetical protein
MTSHGIHHTEKVPLIAQRLGKPNANIAANWAPVPPDPMSGMEGTHRTDGACATGRAAEDEQDVYLLKQLAFLSRRKV